MGSGQLILLVQGAGYERVEAMLSRNGFEVTCAHNGKQAVALAKEITPLLALIDPSSLRIGGNRLCQMLQRAVEPISIVWILSEDEEESSNSQVNAYLRRPITARKLLGCVRKLLPKPATEVLEAGDLVFHIKDRILVKGDQECRLTPKQSALLAALMSHPGEVLSRRYLMKHVWKTDYLGDTRTLEVHIRWVREAIEDNPSKPKYLRTVRGVGYRFDAPKPSGQPEGGADSLVG